MEKENDSQEISRRSFSVCGSELIEIRASSFVLIATPFAKPVAKGEGAEMNNPSNHQPGPSDPRIYFAAERTLLAWVRTGLAMMGFGFVVARFGYSLIKHALNARRRLTESVAPIGSDR